VLPIKWMDFVNTAYTDSETFKETVMGVSKKDMSIALKDVLPKDIPGMEIS
jgi:hypothetical protein